MDLKGVNAKKWKIPRGNCYKIDWKSRGFWKSPILKPIKWLSSLPLMSLSESACNSFRSCLLNFVSVIKRRYSSNIIRIKWNDPEKKAKKMKTIYHVEITWCYTEYLSMLHKVWIGVTQSITWCYAEYLSMLRRVLLDVTWSIILCYVQFSLKLHRVFIYVT